ncbi:TIGR03759 family integrating conjugative element protein [Motilimonas pumila]|nr:TIGR03759 family integrating conjugative element protein [Motilimonas pumila]
MNRHFMTLLACSLSLPTWAADVTRTDTNPVQRQSLTHTSTATSTEHTQTQAKQLGLTQRDIIKAKNWGLTLAQWSRYKSLMAYSPRGTWSKDIDPITALGVSADTEQEREHYARLLLKIEAQRIAKEVAFENTRKRIAQQMFKDQPIVRLPRPSKKPAFTDYVALFAARTCPKSCQTFLRGAIESTPAYAKIDLYIVGATQESHIHQWVTQLAINPALIAQGRITVNYDAGKAQQLKLKSLPARLVVSHKGEIKDETYH